jgi:hypothetical protein
MPYIQVSKSPVAFIVNRLKNRIAFCVVCATHFHCFDACRPNSLPRKRGGNLSRSFVELPDGACLQHSKSVFIYLIKISIWTTVRSTESVMTEYSFDITPEAVEKFNVSYGMATAKLET